MVENTTVATLCLSCRNERHRREGKQLACIKYYTAKSLIWEDSALNLVLAMNTFVGLILSASLQHLLYWDNKTGLPLLYGLWDVYVTYFAL